MEMLSTPEFWLGLLKIIGVNIVLSGDNAVVIALAARSLPKEQQKQAIFWGAGAAVVLRILLTIVAVKLLEFPFLKIVGGLALFWIAIKLLVPEDGDEEVQSSSHLVGAIKTILIADLVMSTDNVLAVAAAAKGSVTLLTLGLLISIPLVVFGATMLMVLMERFPIIITLGAAVLGWTAGEMIVTDPALAEWVNANAAWLHWGAPIGGAVLVVAVGKWLARKNTSAGEASAAEAERPNS
jgi:YjbE family integral membrane protein